MGKELHQLCVVEEQDEMNKKKISIISSTLVAATILVFFTLNNSAISANQSQQDYGLVPPDYPLLSAIPQTSVSDERDASEKIGYAIKFPTYLPSGYSIQLSNVDEGIRAAIILASSEPFTEKTTRDEFIYGQKGIDIYIEPLSSNFNATEWKNLWIQQNDGKMITVGKFNGVMHDTKPITRFDETFVQPATLILFKDDMRVVITSMLSSEQLIKVAESLQ